ncbi:MAG: hypothetical protein AAGF85_00180 [Bacteroidota bacterium]
MKTNKILAILVVILIAVNIATVSFLWFKDSPYKKRMRSNRPPKVEGFLKRKLNLDDEQQRLFQEARKAHFEESKKLMDEMKVFRKQLLISTETNETAITDSLFSGLSQVQSDFEHLNFEHIRTLRGYCNEKQQIAFDSVMGLMFEHLSNPERRRLRKKRGQ